VLFRDGGTVARERRNTNERQEEDDGRGGSAGGHRTNKATLLTHFVGHERDNLA
jgi:hypothetical protein